MNLYWIIINTGITVIGLGVHEILRNYYPETYFLIAFSLSYNTIYLFSVCQKYTMKFYNEYLLPLGNYILETPIMQEPIMIDFKECINTTVNHFIEWYNYFYSVNNGSNNNVDFIKNGNVIYSCVKDALHDEVLNHFKLDYDFIIDNYDGVQKIYEKIPSKLEIPVKSTARFILIEFCIGNEKIDIYFSAEDDSYNYIVVGNKINKSFLLYFMRKHYLNQGYYNVHIEDMYNFSNYNLKIMDDQVNIISLGPEDSIIFTENSFVIQRGDECSISEPTNNEEEEEEKKEEEEEEKEEKKEKKEEEEMPALISLQNEEKKTRNRRKKAKK